MRITHVESIPLAVPLKRRIDAPISLPHAERIASTVFAEYRTTLVRITSEDGTTGVGESMVRLAPEATAAIIDRISPVIIGEDPRDVAHLWELLYGVMLNRGHTKGFFIEALSGIDTAIWDLLGRQAGLPCYKLLGGAHRTSLEAYASSLRFREWSETQQRLDRLWERGFRAFKIKVGRDPSNPGADLAFVERVREYLGDDARLMADANCGYDVRTALKVGAALEELNIEWFEEPLRPDDLEGYHHLAQRLTIPIAAGESEFTRFGMAPFLERRAWAIVQPNAGRAGGITECMRIATLASTTGAHYAPHTGSSSAVAMAVALQLATAVPNFLIYEHMISDWDDQQPNPLRHELLEEPVEVFTEGRMRIPEGPGLGITLNSEILERYRLR